MIALALMAAMACLGLALLLNLFRLVRGPSAPDRIAALDTMFVNAIAVIVLYGIRAGSGVYFEAALLLAMVGFVGTVAFARFLLRGDIIE